MSNESGIDNRRVAKEYASRGLWVFPIAFRGKTPATEHGFQDATLDPETIDRLWASQIARNIGIATGESGLIVIDIDTKDGKQGQESWDALVADHGKATTYAVRTWSGGRHLYFWAPENSPVKNSQSKLAPGIDVRAIGGYVVAPPSIVREGDATGSYAVEDDSPIEECPGWLHEALVALSARPERPALSGPIADQDEVVARVRQLSEELAAIPYGEPAEGKVNEYAFFAGQYAGAGQIQEEAAIRILLDGISGWSWRVPGDATAFEDKIARVVREGMAHPYEWKAARPAEAVAADVPVVDEAKIKTAFEQAVARFKAMGLDPDEPTESAYFTDLRQAENFFRDEIAGRYLWTKQFRWMRWTGVVWQECADERIGALITKWTGRHTEEAVRYAKQLIIDAAGDAVANPENAKMILDKATEMGQALVKGWRGRHNGGRMAQVAIKSRELALREGLEFDANPDVINTPSGIVNLRTGEVRPGRPDDYCRKVTAADYEPGFTHGDIEAAMTAIPDATREWFQRFLGQAMTGYANREDQMAFFTGEGQNGKSAIVLAVKAALGSYFTMVSDQALMGGNVHPTSLMAFYGARIAVLEETEEAYRLNMQRVKKIVGSDGGITARYMNKDEITFQPTHTLIINTNHLPMIEDNGGATWRRLLAVPFPYKYLKPHEEATEDYHRKGDLGLKARLSRPAQAKAMLAWMVQGAMKWYATGEVMGELPADVAALTDSWHQESDQVAAFLADGGAFLVPTAHVSAHDLLTAVNAWLRSNGHNPWSARTLAKRLESSTILGGRVTSKRLRPGAPGFSLHPRNDTFGFDAPGYNRAVPDKQYTAWLGLSFAPMASVAQQEDPAAAVR